MLIVHFKRKEKEMVNEGQAQMYRERALAQARWERKNVSNILDARGKSIPNPEYVKRELVDGKVIETMPNKVEKIEEEEQK